MLFLVDLNAGALRLVVQAVGCRSAHTPPRFDGSEAFPLFSAGSGLCRLPGPCLAFQGHLYRCGCLKAAKARRMTEGLNLSGIGNDKRYTFLSTEEGSKRHILWLLQVKESCERQVV